MSQPSGSLPETSVEPGECVWPWRENVSWEPACRERTERKLGRAVAGRPDQEEEETFFIGQRFARLHLCQRR